MVNINVNRNDESYRADIVSKNHPVLSFCASNPEQALRRALLAAYNDNHSEVTITSIVDVTVDENLRRLFDELTLTVDPQTAWQVSSFLLEQELAQEERSKEEREARKMMAPFKIPTPRFEDYAALPSDLRATALSMYPPHVRDFFESYDVNRSSREPGWTIKHDPIPPMRTSGSSGPFPSGVHGV